MARISNKSGKLNQENKSWSGRKERIKNDKKKKKTDVYWSPEISKSYYAPWRDLIFLSRTNGSYPTVTN